MEYKIISSHHFKPISWSGGTTTELFIFPLTADYQLRNFQFRLSSATVETDKSEFTSLPGVSRKLMVLDGKITINHEEHYSRQLKKFDTDEFGGDWKTSSIGRCTDFNLMTTGKTTGNLSAFAILNEQNANCIIKDNCDWFFIYMHSGKVRVDMNNKLIRINKGDLLIVNNPINRIFEITGVEKSELVFSEITL